MLLLVSSDETLIAECVLFNVFAIFFLVVSKNMCATYFLLQEAVNIRHFLCHLLSGLSGLGWHLLESVLISDNGTWLFEYRSALRKVV